VSLPLGAEFHAAYEATLAVGARIVLGDRPIQVTLRRLWAGLSMWQRLRLGFELLRTFGSDISREDIERLKSGDVLEELVAELGTRFPSIAVPLGVLSVPI
jgi:pheromone shutdown protein TraB